MKYVANPVIVDAFEILQVKPVVVDKPELLTAGSYILHLDNGNQMTATAEMCARMTPAVGDFAVIQEDKYVYLNPRAIFLRKYRLIPNQKEV